MTILPYLADKCSGFDEEKFVDGCLQRFAEIRRNYDLDKENLEKAQENLQLRKLAAQILDGYTREGILAIYNRDKWKIHLMSWFMIPGIINVVPQTMFDQTVYRIENMSRTYEDNCRLLWSGLRKFMT